MSVPVKAAFPSKKKKGAKTGVGPRGPPGPPAAVVTPVLTSTLGGLPFTAPTIGALPAPAVPIPPPTGGGGAPIGGAGAPPLAAGVVTTPPMAATPKAAPKAETFVRGDQAIDRIWVGQVASIKGKIYRKVANAAKGEVAEIDWCADCNGNMQCGTCGSTVAFMSTSGPCWKCVCEGRLGLTVPLWYSSPVPCARHCTGAALAPAPRSPNPSNWISAATDLGTPFVPSSKSELCSALGLNVTSTRGTERREPVNPHAVMAACRLHVEAKLLYQAMLALNRGGNVFLVNARRLRVNEVPSAFRSKLTLMESPWTPSSAARSPSPAMPYDERRIREWLSTAAAGDFIGFLDSAYLFASGNGHRLTEATERGVGVSATYQLSPTQGGAVLFPIPPTAFMATDAPKIEGIAIRNGDHVHVTIAGNANPYEHPVVSPNWQIVGNHVGGMCLGNWSPVASIGATPFVGSGSQNLFSNALQLNLPLVGGVAGTTLVLPDFLRSCIPRDGNQATTKTNLASALGVFYNTDRGLVTALRPTTLSDVQVNELATIAAAVYHPPETIPTQVVRQYYANTSLFQRYVFSKAWLTVPVLFAIFFSSIMMWNYRVYVPVFSVQASRLTSLSFLLICLCLITRELLGVLGQGYVDEVRRRVLLELIWSMASALLYLLTTWEGLPQGVIYGGRKLVSLWWLVLLCASGWQLAVDYYKPGIETTYTFDYEYFPYYLFKASLGLTRWCTKSLGDYASWCPVFERGIVRSNSSCITLESGEGWFGGWIKQRCTGLVVHTDLGFLDWLYGLVLGYFANWVPNTELHSYIAAIRFFFPLATILPGRLVWAFTGLAEVLDYIIIEDYLPSLPVIGSTASILFSLALAIFGLMVFFYRKRVILCFVLLFFFYATLSFTFSPFGLLISLCSICRAAVDYLRGRGFTEYIQPWGGLLWIPLLFADFQRGRVTSMVLATTVQRIAGPPVWEVWHFTLALVVLTLFFLPKPRLPILITRNMFQSIFVPKFVPGLHAGTRSKFFGKHERTLKVLKDIPTALEKNKSDKYVVGGVSVLRASHGSPACQFYGSEAAAKAVLTRNIDITVIPDSSAEEWRQWRRDFMDIATRRLGPQGPRVVVTYLEKHAMKFAGAKRQQYSFLARLLDVGEIPGYTLTKRTWSQRALDGYLSGFTKLEHSKIKGNNSAEYEGAVQSGNLLGWYEQNPTKPRTVTFPTALSDLGNIEVANVVAAHALVNEAKEVVSEHFPCRVDFEQPLNRVGDEAEEKLESLVTHDSDVAWKFEAEVMKNYLHTGSIPERRVTHALLSTFCSKVWNLARRRTDGKVALSLFVPFDRLVNRAGTLSGDQGKWLPNVWEAKLTDLMRLNEGCEFSVMFLQPLLDYVRRVTGTNPVSIKPTNDWTPVFAEENTREPIEAGSRLTAIYLGVDADALRDELKRFADWMQAQSVVPGMDTDFGKQSPFAAILLPQSFPILNQYLNPQFVPRDVIGGNSVAWPEAAALYLQNPTSYPEDHPLCAILSECAVTGVLGDVRYVRREFDYDDRGSRIEQNPHRGLYKNLYTASAVAAKLADASTPFEGLIMVGAGRPAVVDAAARAFVEAGGTVVVIEDDACGEVGARVTYGWANPLNVCGQPVNQLAAGADDDARRAVTALAPVRAGHVNRIPIGCCDLLPTVLGTFAGRWLLWSDVPWKPSDLGGVTRRQQDRWTDWLPRAELHCVVKHTRAVMRSAVLSGARGVLSWHALLPDPGFVNDGLYRGVGHKSETECYSYTRGTPIVMHDDPEAFRNLLACSAIDALNFARPLPPLPLQPDTLSTYASAAQAIRVFGERIGVFVYNHSVMDRFRAISDVALSAGRPDLANLHAIEVDASCCDGTHQEGLALLTEDIVTGLGRLLPSFDADAFMAVLTRPLTGPSFEARLANQESLALSSGLPWTTFANTTRYLFVADKSAQVVFGRRARNDTHAPVAHHQLLIFAAGDDFLSWIRCNPSGGVGSPLAGTH